MATKTTSTDESLPLSLKFYTDEFTIYKLPLTARIPPSIFQLSWYSVTKTDEEISIMLISKELESTRELEIVDGIKKESGWFAMKIDGVLDFSLVGILASVINPLKEVKIPVFVISTFNTDYIFIQKPNEARKELEKAGYKIEKSSI